MGTILNGRVDVFHTIVAALAKNKNLQLVLSIGDQVDPKQIGPVPNNAIIVKRAPQLELLKQTSVCITHAGLNTVLLQQQQGKAALQKIHSNQIVELDLGRTRALSFSSES